MKKIILLLVSTFLLSCDPLYHVMVNGGKNYTLNTCGGIKVFCRGHTGLSFYLNMVPLKKSITIDPEKAFLAIESSNPSIDFAEIRFFINETEIAKDTVSRIRPNEKLTIKLYGFREDGVILIPPGDYLMCGQNPIITKTIRIE